MSGPIPRITTPIIHVPTLNIIIEEETPPSDNSEIEEPINDN